MSDRKETIDRLRAVELTEGMSSHAMLSAICKAVMPCKTWKRLTCEGMRDELIRMLEDAWKDGFDDGFASADDWLADHEDAMREHGWVRAEDSMPLPRDMDGNRVYAGDWVTIPNNEVYQVAFVAMKSYNRWCVVIERTNDPRMRYIVVDCDKVQVWRKDNR